MLRSFPQLKSLALMLASILGCLSTPALSGSVSGIIRADGGRPIANVRIRAWDHDPASRDELLGKSMTGKNGAYRIQFTNKRWDGLKNGPSSTTNRPDIYITVELRVRGHWEEIGRSKIMKDYQQSRPLVLNLAGVDRRSAFVRRTVYGTIRDRKGRPIGGMTVRAWDKDFIKKPELMGTAISNKRGHYQIVYRKRNWDGPKTGFSLGNTANPDIFITVQKRKSGKTLAKSSIHRDHPSKKRLRINVKLPR